MEALREIGLGLLLAGLILGALFFASLGFTVLWIINAEKSGGRQARDDVLAEYGIHIRD
jgi:UPF0716 family protein affecting phage T7 exclusion